VSGRRSELSVIGRVSVIGRRPELSVILRLVGAVALLALMLLTSWYGLSRPARGPFGAAGSTSAGVWHTLRVIRWFLLLAIASAVLSLGVRRRLMLEMALLLGVIATLSLAVRLLIVLPDPRAVLDVKVGGYLGLIACATLTLGAWEGPAHRSPAPGASDLTEDAPGIRID
jgi:hypothetical protein